MNIFYLFYYYFYFIQLFTNDTFSTIFLNIIGYGTHKVTQNSVGEGRG
jgi:hypothetical protein